MIKKSRQKISISPTRFATYAMAGAAAVVGADDANADLTYRLLNELIEDTTAPAVNDGGDVFDIKFGDADSFNMNFYHGLGANTASNGFAITRGNSDGVVTPGVSIAGFPAAGYNYASNVASGANISALANWLAPAVSGTMANNAGFPNDQFKDPGEHFLAARFNSGSGFAYGWVRVNMVGVPINSFTIVDYAFKDPGEQILVGEGIPTAVPEPGSLAMLALGSVGFAAWRRRRKTA